MQRFVFTDEAEKAIEGGMDIISASINKTPLTISINK
jgi:hypothetical protein